MNVSILRCAALVAALLALLGCPHLQVLAQGPLCEHPRKLLQGPFTGKPVPIDDCDDGDPNPPPSCKANGQTCTTDYQCCSPYLCRSRKCTYVNCDDAIMYNLGKVSEWMKEAHLTRYTTQGYAIVRSRAAQLQSCTRSKDPKSAADKMQKIDEAFEDSGSYPYDRYDYTGASWQPIGNPLFGLAIAAAYKVPLSEGVSCTVKYKERLCQGSTCGRSGIATPAYLVAISTTSPYERWSTSEGRQYLETTSAYDMVFWYKKRGWSFRRWVERKRHGGRGCVFMSG